MASSGKSSAQLLRKSDSNCREKEKRRRHKKKENSTQIYIHANNPNLPKIVQNKVLFCAT